MTIPTPSSAPKGQLADDTPNTVGPCQGAGPSGTFGRFRIEKVLGSGGMGTVYLAEDTGHLRRKVALKVSLCPDANSPSAGSVFREARLAARLAHPNICPVYEVDEVGGVPYIAMAYLDGLTLAQRLAQNPPLSQAEAVALTLKLTLALDVAHKAGVLHRDLKPANVMLYGDLEPILMDFGLARGTHEATLNPAGQALGTPAYMPIEQIRLHPLGQGPHSDVYSLGVILYETLSGRKPFNGNSFEILVQILNDTPPPPSSHRQGIDPALEAICLRAMAREPADRYPGMAPLAVALRQWLSASEGSPRRPAVPAAPLSRVRSKTSIADVQAVHSWGWDGPRLLDALIALDYEMFDGLTPEDEGHTEQWHPVFLDHPDTWRLLVDATNAIIGYWHFVPLVPEDYEAARKGQFDESNITTDRLEFFEVPGTYNLYFVSIGVISLYRTAAYFKQLFDSLFEVVAGLADQDVLIGEICTNAYTHYGLSICKSLGMSYVCDHKSRGKIYAITLRKLLETKFAGRHERLLRRYLG